MSDLPNTLLGQGPGLYCFSWWSEAGFFEPRAYYWDTAGRGNEVRWIIYGLWSTSELAGGQVGGIFPLVLMQGIFSPYLQSWHSWDLPSDDSTQTNASSPGFSAPWVQWPENKTGCIARHLHPVLRVWGIWQVFVGPVTIIQSRTYIIQGPLFLTMDTHSGQYSLLHDIWEMAHPFLSEWVILGCSHDLSSSGVILVFLRSHELYSTDFILTPSFMCRWHKTSSLPRLPTSYPRFK